MRQVLREAAGWLDIGALPVFVIEGDHHDLAYAGQLSDLQFPLRQTGLDERFRPALLHMPMTGEGVAQRCAEHNPGRPLGVVSISATFPVGAEDEPLLMRAFSDASSIDIVLLQERPTPRGPSRVYKVRSHTEDVSSPIYWVVKTLPLSDADSERGILSFSVPGNTPFANVPPVAADPPPPPPPSVSTSSRSSIVMPFVDRADVFVNFIETHSPALAVASLFDGPLRCWRSKWVSEQRNVGRYGARQIATTNASRYMAAFRNAKKAGANPRSPRELLKALQGQGKTAVKLCFSHGDLHLGNIFVRHGSNDVVLIDFNRGGQAPASRDPAELDAALAFTNATGRTSAALNDDVLQTLYARPILAPSVQCRTASPRAHAIEQIRRQVVGTCSEDEYRLMLAAHCLWWAKHGNGQAYLAADRLV